MNDNRLNEPTPEQVEAAAKAIREVDGRSALIADVDLPEYRARAALEAADAACCAHPKCPGGSLCCCQSDAVVTEEQLASAIDERLNEARDMRSRGGIPPFSPAEVAAKVALSLLRGGAK